jgi:hypothetical protein
MTPALISEMALRRESGISLSEVGKGHGGGRERAQVTCFLPPPVFLAQTGAVDL